MSAGKPIIAAIALVFFATTLFAQTSETRFQRELRRGIELHDAGQYAAARKMLAGLKSDVATDNTSTAETIDRYVALSAAATGDPEAELLLNQYVNTYQTIYADRVYITLGHLYQRRKNYAAALDAYRRVDPYALSATERSELFFNRGYSAFCEEDHDEALHDFDRVGADRVYAPSATYYKAYIAYINGDYGEARRGFSSLADDRNYGPVIPFYLVQIDFKDQKYEAVAQAAPALISQATGERLAELQKIAGESFFHLGDYRQSLYYLKQYAAQHPSLTREEQYITGYAAYMEGELPLAVALLERVAVGDDLLAQNAAYHIGSISVREGKKPRAVQAFSLAMNLDRDPAVQEEAMFNFAKLQYEAGGGVFNETINTLTRYTGLFPDSPRIDEARRLLMAAYFNSRNYTAAYEAIELIKNPDNETRQALQKIAYFRGLEFYEGGDLENAQKMFTLAAANRLTPKYTALTNYWQAETYYRQGDYTRAIPLYQDYVVLSPKTELENQMANYNLGYCCFQTKNYREASTWFNRFISVYTPQDQLKADGYDRVGDLHFLNKDYTQAIESYDHAIRIGGVASQYASFQRAIALGLTQGTGAKITALKAIIGTRSEYVDEAMYELGSTYTKQEQFTEAAATLKQFIDRYPASPLYPSALSGLGLICQNMGNNTEALRYYKMVVEQRPNAPQSKDALLGIRNIYVDRNDLDGYFSFAREHGVETNAMAIERDSLTFFVAERIYLTGDSHRAEPLMETYLRQFPNGGYVANATYYLADCQMQQDDVENALANYEKVVGMPFGPFTANALLNAGGINAARENYAKASEQYLRLSKLSVSRTVIAQALAGYLRAESRSADPDRWTNAANYVIASGMASDEAVADAKFLLAKADLQTGGVDRALTGFREVAANPKTMAGAEAQYRMIKILYDRNDFGSAEAEVMKFAQSNTPQQYWLAQSFLILGDIYLKRNDAFQAKATFQSIVDGYTATDDGVLDAARAKLNSIGQ
ncbi:MAG: tetratricopeptide repeat protein [Rikenellaceae bacterium]|jgi:TolA-binding protein|nr:tetratricopeptide repeat protein [Rikenellaceae bacterium]